MNQHVEYIQMGPLASQGISDDPGDRPTRSENVMFHRER